ncbi:hypothetical protein I553_7960 [Mycobacterium xenopi 4042]|uniref:Uncharacterized protein n=1 Tax=Mycobacterium xenopi 4042 TaxID=1299334 RepID=X8DCP2_MYCXE|nr:hypothetical protein I553_7960 [Mycobacterium xenopi 4042]
MFGADHIETLLERFARLLTAMTAEPTRRWRRSTYSMPPSTPG